MEKIKIIILLFLLSVFIEGCIDTKIESENRRGKVRIEFTNCTSCGSCVNSFNCPQNAIKLNEFGTSYEIDASKCTSCGLCITEFKCPNLAITRDQDVIKPGVIKDIEVSEKGSGYVILSWGIGGDDGHEGYPLKYVIIVSEKEIVDEKSEGVIKVINNKDGYNSDDISNGYVEEKIDGLTNGKSYYIGIKAVDEAGNSSVISFIKVSI